MKITRDVFISFDGKSEKGLEVWNIKPEWIIPPKPKGFSDSRIKKDPYFDTKKEPSSIYLATHSKNNMGLEKGEVKKAKMTIEIKLAQ
ncbi:MAG: hypothetical protein ACFFBD_09235 [Candidatus Hodarchaeota archaeon]